ncbi:hypothetical protein OHD62_18315 [Mesorhizobium sp. YC-39]|uniref:hypothetical protein n=1 Tax=unclassified Mesorhizobium TaxID=325217 RepID=UPI0021E741CC|nr:MULTISPECIES: hypothetical protein [unclassified Mesorhizobium]MCV3209799.1 hypothetical protein [Mesorhizobium sp. YC-2]MCV3230329.1 hypothetical protein [Mesorhizobium sp. YC-39]
MSRKGKQEKPVPYEEGTPPDWDTAVGSFTITKRREGSLEKSMLTGACPRCRHAFLKDISDVVVQAFAPETIRYAWRCGCGLLHAGAPAGTTGCGASGVLEITPVLKVAPK